MWTVARGIDGTPPGSLQAEAFKRVGSIKREMTFTFQAEDVRRDSSKKVSHQHLFPLAMEEDVKTTDTKKASRALDHEKENTRSICLLEQKRKVVSSNIDVPPARISRERDYASHRDTVIPCHLYMCSLPSTECEQEVLANHPLPPKSASDTDAHWSVRTTASG
nr:PREDICTED: zinc finger protein 704-like isoform X2 [Equus przewalskii]